MGVEEVGVGGDVFDMVRSVGGGEDFDIDKLAGGIKGETEIGGAGIAAEMIGLGRGGEIVTEEFFLGVADFV